MLKEDLSSKEIWDFQTEKKDGILTFGETLRSDVKKDLVDFTQHANQRLAKVETSLISTDKINESLIGKLEHWEQEANDALIISLREQKALRDMFGVNLESTTGRSTESQREKRVSLQDLLGRRRTGLPKDPSS